MKHKRTILSLAILAVCAATAAFRWPDYDWGGAYWWQGALAALWPVLMGTLALTLTKAMAKTRKWWICGVYLLYFAIAGLGIVCMRWHHVPWLRFEITETVYLILSADIALWSVSTRCIFAWETAGLVRHITPGLPDKFLLTKQLEMHFFAVNMKFARLVNTVAANLLAVYLLLRHDRLWDILFGRVGLKPWLEYRAQSFDVNIDWAGAACAVVAFGLMLLLFRSLPTEHNVVHIFRGTVLCLAARSVIGLACELFGISSSSLRVLLSGSPWDIISIAALLILVPISVKMEEVEAHEYSKWLRQGPLSALGRIKPPAAAPSQGGSQAC